MNLNKKILIFTLMFYFGALPSFSKIDGNVSREFFYDNHSAIMTDTETAPEIKTGKYWDKNMFEANKYRPIFMLSNKELIKLMPEQKISVVQRIHTPSIYNISLKSATIKSVSLKPLNNKKTEAKKAEIKKIVPIAKKPDVNTISKYEQAKNKGVSAEEKLNTAIIIMGTNKASNYDLAIDLLDDVTQKEPYNAYAFYLKGELFAQKKNSEKAIQNYVEALRINPISKQSYLGIAKVLEPTNKELAQKYYERAR